MAERDNVRPKERPRDARGTFARLLRYAAQQRGILLLVLALCLLSNVLALFGPSLAGKAINEAAAGRGKVNFGKVTLYAEQMLFCYVFSSMLTVAISVVMMNIGRRIARRMRADVFEKLMKLPVRYFDRNQAGDIISRVSYDIDVISTSFSTDLTQIMTSSVTIIGSFAMMLIICPPLVIITVVTIPAALLYTRFMGHKTRPLYAARSRNYGRMNGFVEEMYSGQKTIQAYAYEDAVCREFDGINKDAAGSFCNAEYWGMSTGPSVGFINNLGLSLICMAGSLFYLNGIVTLGQISSFILYSRKFSGPINEIANIINEIYSALAAAERVFRMLDEEEEPADAEGAETLGAETAPTGRGTAAGGAADAGVSAGRHGVQGRVELRNVFFGYDPGRIILHDVSLAAEPGRMVAIVGPTGAGKTTIINLLMRFYDVTDGGIYVDGREIRTLTRRSLRRAYAMVLQDSWMFNGTIYDNIAYGRENATREEVVKAAEAAHIHSFIMRLPDGYDTMIGEDGGNISKGQKQMLTIARAFLYEAGMLIFDEATSNVDTATEQSIQKAMRGTHGRQDMFCHRPPPFDDPERGSDPRRERRGYRGAGHARKPDGGEGFLL
jgi:ATP-binding cassette subfamily B multidrug efflux pump